MSVPSPVRDGSLKERYGDEIVVYGPADPLLRTSVMSFTYKDVHAHDLSQVLDQARVRAGRAPLRQTACTPAWGGATAWASFSVYNDEATSTPSWRDRRSRRTFRLNLWEPLDAWSGRSYREIILDHYHNPRNRGELESPPAIREEGSTRSAETKSSCTST